VPGPSEVSLFIRDRQAGSEDAIHPGRLDLLAAFLNGWLVHDPGILRRAGTHCAWGIRVHPAFDHLWSARPTAGDLTAAEDHDSAIVADSGSDGRQ